MANIKTLAICAFALAVASCGSALGLPTQSTTPSTSNTPATSTSTSTGSSQSNQGLGGLDDLLGGLGNAGGIVDVISNALGITTTDIVGTWVYQEPAVMFESDNFLTNAGGKVAAQTVANKLDTYFQKVGIKKGKMSMTFDRDGNFVQKIGNKETHGTYTVEDGKVNLTFSSGMKQFVGTTQFDGNNLVIVVDVTKLMNFAQTIASAAPNSTLNTIGSLVSGFSGMKAGLEFKKQR